MPISAEEGMSSREEDKQKESSPDPLAVITEFMSQQGEGSLRLVTDGGASGEIELELSRSVLQALQKVLELMERGEEVDIVARERELTTTEAAELLNVSRPYVVKLMESGELPFHKVGSHRRVEAGDVVEYKRRQKSASRKSLAALADEDEKLDTEY